MCTVFYSTGALVVLSPTAEDGEIEVSYDRSDDQSRGRGPLLGQCHQGGLALQEREDWVAAIRYVADRLVDSDDVDMASPDCSISCGDGYDVTTIDELSAKFSVQGTSSSKTSGKKKVLMDQGVLESLEEKYRRRLPSNIIAPNTEVVVALKSVDMFDVIRWVSEAWDEILSVTLVRSRKMLLEHKARER
uniref:(California timema) hypothetical protein n=1 Tax=Timema californicum TaxID=61474 RepID=A0A7R9P6U6_TIMCA|nr:unnamed protein product [Timema californicum]